VIAVTESAVLISRDGEFHVCLGKRLELIADCRA
jgi:hypothetical protein